MSTPVTDAEPPDAVPQPTAAPDVTDPDALEQLARTALHPAVFDYFAGGAGDETALHDNLLAWRGLRLRTRVLRAVSTVDTATTVLGCALRVPIAVAPMGFQRLAHPDGEGASAAAAAACGAGFALSTYATTSIEDVLRAA
jgi:4-hydroxymandelate oxidase